MFMIADTDLNVFMSTTTTDKNLPFFRTPSSAHTEIVLFSSIETAEKTVEWVNRISLEHKYLKKLNLKIYMFQPTYNGMLQRTLETFATMETCDFLERQHTTHKYGLKDPY